MVVAGNASNPDSIASSLLVEFHASTVIFNIHLLVMHLCPVYLDG